ncbi:MAG: hypothetical protein WAT58_12155 [Candidatus Dormiibacterota bacterium]
MALVVAALLGVAAWFGLRQADTRVVVVPSASVDIHSPEAVMAAVRHYYEVEAEARRTGNGDLIDAVTSGHDSIASYNFRLFIQQEAIKKHRSVTLETHLEKWAVTLDADRASATYVLWLRGHDTDSLTGDAVEPDQNTTKGAYRMDLRLGSGAWKTDQRQLLQNNVP